MTLRSRYRAMRDERRRLKNFHRGLQRERRSQRRKLESFDSQRQALERASQHTTNGLPR